MSDDAQTMHSKHACSACPSVDLRSVPQPDGDDPGRAQSDQDEPAQMNFCCCCICCALESVCTGGYTPYMSFLEL